MEDVDLEVKLGLESKLVNLIEQHGFQEIGSNQKAPYGTSPVILNGLGNPSLSDVSHMLEITKPLVVRYASQYTFNPKPREGSVFRALSPCPPEPSHPQNISRETPHRCKACEKLGYYRGPPALVCAPQCVDLERWLTTYSIASSGMRAPSKAAPYPRDPGDLKKEIPIWCTATGFWET